MAFMTKYGTIWGMIPSTAGRIFWVAPSASYTVEGRSYSASDDNDGLSPERALLTVDRAWNLVTANAGDVIVLLPGTHTVGTTTIEADIAGVTMMGLPSGAGNIIRQKTIIQMTSADELLNVTAADIELGYLHFIPTSAQEAVQFNGGADRLHIHHCSFDMSTPAVSTSTVGIQASAAADNVLIDNCYFIADGAQGPCIDLGGCVQSVVLDSEFVNTSGVLEDAILIGAGANAIKIKRCDFNATAGATINDGIEGSAVTAAVALAVVECYFSDRVLVPIETFGATEAIAIESYRGTITGTTAASALVVLID